MQQLNLPEYAFKIKKVGGGKKQIFDAIRKKYVVLQPEEWVRQNFAQFLIQDRKYSASLMVFEHSLKYNGRSKRGDIVLFGKDGKPKLIVECKAPNVKIDESVFDQAAQYNMKLQLDYMIVTNGMQHYCCKIDRLHQKYTFLREIPTAQDL
ncbi:type I restriction enzyme HsdR N-terminal domain-containing protein [Flavobacteriales bacterium]|jgi:type I site-specific restriction endonuclease|nr:type I restriction enzyme HsdR N-terminal domain-containing protein [Flavobacteriales bacterium]